jgi:hypothetical protein
MVIMLITLLVFIGVIIGSIFLARFITSLYIKSISYCLRKIGLFNVGKQSRNSRYDGCPKITPINIIKSTHKSSNRVSKKPIITSISNNPINKVFCGINFGNNYQNKDKNCCRKNNPRNFKGFFPTRLDNVSSIPSPHAEQSTTEVKGESTKKEPNHG